MGLIEVLIIEAHGLPNHDYFHKMDPYVLLGYKGQERKTSVARGQGGNPKWNENLSLRAEYPGSGGDYTLSLKLMDKDTFSADDFIGQTTICVEDLLASGKKHGRCELQTMKYRVENLEGSYCGDITVSARFTSQGITEEEEEDLGGWKDSYDD